MSVTSRPFGHTADGTPVTCYTLSDRGRMSVAVLDYGCTIQSLTVRGVDVALGYDTIEEYERNDSYLGAVIGRHANRIGGGVFSLNGTLYSLVCNDGHNHLHGGRQGFDRRVWDARVEEDGLTLSRVSPDGEEGYPGTLHVSVRYALRGDGTLAITYRAQCDADTVLNLTNHCYFNLNGQGQGTILGHALRLDAQSYTENDGECLPTGVIAPTAGTPFDFRAGKALGDEIHCGHPQLRSCGGYDHNLILSGAGLRTVGTLTGEVSGISMDVRTDQPGLQLYTGNFLTPRVGKGGTRYDRHSGVCLETQHFPNAMAHPHFPSVVLKKEEPFFSVTEYRFR